MKFNRHGREAGADYLEPVDSQWRLVKTGRGGKGGWNAFGHLLTEGLPFLSVAVLLATLAFFGGRCPVSLAQGRCETVAAGVGVAKACCRSTGGEVLRKPEIVRETGGKGCCPGAGLDCKERWGGKGETG